MNASVLLGHSDLNVNVVVSVDIAVHLADAFALQTDGLVHRAAGGNLGTGRTGQPPRLAKTSPFNSKAYHTESQLFDTARIAIWEMCGERVCRAEPTGQLSFQWITLQAVQIGSSIDTSCIYTRASTVHDTRYLTLLK